MLWLQYNCVHARTVRPSHCLLLEPNVIFGKLHNVRLVACRQVGAGIFHPHFEATLGLDDGLRERHCAALADSRVGVEEKCELWAQY